jgi:hypothetical protein
VGSGFCAQTGEGDVRAHAQPAKAHRVPGDVGTALTAKRRPDLYGEMGCRRSGLRSAEVGCESTGRYGFSGKKQAATGPEPPIGRGVDALTTGA